MQHGYICVAGVDVDTNRHVRPEAYGRLSLRLLARHGGPFAIGHVVDLGATTPTGRPPEVEDHRFEPRRATRRRVVPPSEFWTCLMQVAKPRLADIFGPQLAPRGRRTCGVDAGQGEASLGCLLATGTLDLYLRPRPDKPAQVRMHLSDGDFDVDISVTDMRLYDDDMSPATDAVRHLAEQLKIGTRTILSVGLTRAFAPDPALPAVHWLQVNNIHPEDNPIW
jgi:hypothetical protein